ncbi:MAG: DUF502 domain-containing protein [Candidatus Marithrix sp.]|nr:DUF502 domain-containing protein [Candidatus Marithrix sp.]
MQNKHSISHYLITGILTVIPISLTWVVFNFLFIQLSKIGTPLMSTLAGTLQKASPNLAKFILTLDPLISSIFAVILTLIALYLLGWMATLVIGKRIIKLLDLIIEQVPFVKTIYGSTKKFLSALQTEPGNVQRVVLINFPSSEMKTVGFVTRILTDDHTGQELAAVYVPTTPNPTSGYLEIVPIDKIISTDWTVDEAMAFIISGGTVAPDSLNYTQSPDKK